MKEEFWTIVCERTPHLRAIFIGLWVLLVGAGFSILFTSPGSASHVIAVFDVILILVAMAVTLFLQWRCARHEQSRGEWQTEENDEA